MMPESAVKPIPSPWLNWLYAGLALLFVVVVSLLLQQRPDVETITPTIGDATVTPIATSTAPAVKRDAATAAVMLAMFAVIASGYLLGKLFALIGQPAVIGEIIAGILLGPSCLGQLWPAAAAQLFPSALYPAGKDQFGIIPLLTVVANLGVVLYMFLIGLEFDFWTVMARGKTALFIAHASIVVPFVLGSGLAWFLHTEGYAGAQVGFAPFALFLGVSLAITAFPVLVRILKEHHLQGTEFGLLAIACAAVDDLTAWCLLAFVVGVARADLGPAFQVLGLTVIYMMAMFFVVRPVLTRWAEQNEATAENRSNWFVLLLCALLLSGWLTEMIGISAIFGAFFLGAAIPASSKVAQLADQKMHDLVRCFFLPAFFALTGIKTQFGLLQGTSHVVWCIIIIAVAILGKYGGTLLAARYGGYSWRTASALGLLLNTRGLIGLIVLNIGLELGVINQTLYAMLVVMALVTTAMTTPLLLLSKPERTAVVSIHRE